MYKGMLDMLVIGHSTHDIIVREHRTFSRLGGPPPYISRLLESLNRAVGAKAKENFPELDYAIVSKVGPDFRYFTQLCQEPLVATKPTTCFVHHYQRSERVMEVENICEAIFPEDIKSEFRIGLIMELSEKFYLAPSRGYPQFVRLPSVMCRGSLERWTTRKESIMLIWPTQNSAMCSPRSIS